MERNSLRKKLPERLNVVDLEYDIESMVTEMKYHKSKSLLFEETIQALKNDLNKVKISQKPYPVKEGVYQ